MSTACGHPQGGRSYVDRGRGQNLIVLIIIINDTDINALIISKLRCNIRIRK